MRTYTGQGRVAALATGVVCATALALQSARAQDQQESAEETVKRLERRMDAVIREVEQLREEVAKSNKRAAVPDELRRDVNQLKGQVAEVKEQATAADAKAEQNGVRAYLGPGLIFEDPRGRWRLQASARAQLDYRAFWPQFADANTFSIRRARIGLGAAIMSDYYVYVEEEFANQATNPAPPTGPQLTFAFIDLNWFRPGVKFRLGQFKPFIGLDNTMLDLQTDFLERALTQSLFQNLTYERGVMVFGEPIAGLVYSAALTNGTGQGNDELQGNLQQTQGDGKMYTLRAVGDFAQFFQIPDSVIHLGGTYQRGSEANSGVNNQTPFTAASVQTEARGLTFFSPQAFNPANAAAVNSNITRTAIDLEAAYAYGPYKIQGDYVRVDYAGTHFSPQFNFDPTLRAYYVTLGWVFTGESYADWYRDGTFVRPRAKNNFAWGPQGGWGLWEVDFRYSSFDGTDFNTTNPQFTGRLGTSSSFPNITQGTNKANAYSLGLKWLPNYYSRFMLNLIHTAFDTPVIVNGSSTDYENAITLRAQVDF